MAGTWFGGTFIGDDTNDTANGTEADEILIGNKGNDTLNGKGGNDRLDGGVGDDTIDGGEGNDELTDVGSIPSDFVGLIGRDRLRGGDGDDRLNFLSIDTGDFAFGGSGTDTIVMRLTGSPSSPIAPTTVFKFVLGPGGTDSVARLNDINTVAVTGIERLEFIGAGGGVFGSSNDFITGGALDDRLYGGAGDDHLFGGGGDDTIDGGEGQQDLDGGDGFDTVSFTLASDTAGFVIKNQVNQKLGSFGSARNFEAYYDITTGSGDDRFNLTQTSIVLISSGAGADTITVGDGGSGIDAGIGDDIITTGAGSDTIDGGDGNNVVRMGDGDDQYYHESTRAYLGRETVHGDGGNDDIYTAAGADTAYGGTGIDLIYTGGGSDVAYGGEGDDRILAENGSDKVYGGAGNDTLSADDDANFDTLPENDRIEGGDGNDTISGGAGLDRLYGDAGDDVVYVSPQYFSDDLIVTDTQIDQAFGGSGTDVFHVGNATSTAIPQSQEVTIIFGAVTQVKYDGVVVAEGRGFERLNVNNLIDGDTLIEASGLNDEIYSGSGDDVIRTYGGDDSIGSFFGADTVYAGDGNDLIGVYLGGKDEVYAGAGDDSVRINSPFLSQPPAAGVGKFDGGGGFDTLILQGSDRVISISGSSILFEGVKVGSFKNFEAIELNGGNATETVKGTSAADILRGFGGNDVLDGLGGDDLIDGGTGDDTLSGGAGTDALISGSGADEVFGGDGDDSLALTFDGLADTVSGGDGIDTITIGFSFLTPITMTGSLATGATITAGGVVQAEVDSVEQMIITGSSGDDILIGGSGNDDITGGTGVDSITTGAGDDRARISLDVTGPDTVNLGSGTDTVVISTSRPGAVRMVLASTMRVEVDGVVVATVRDAEVAEFGGGAGDDVLTGGGFADALGGGLGANTLRGLGGDDRISVQLDAALDAVFGGDGNDQFIISSSVVGGIVIDVSVPGTVTVRTGGVIVAEAGSVESLVVYDSSAADDILRGLDGNDEFYAFGGRDTLSGNGGDDRMGGGIDDDTLFGGSGNDTLGGGAGLDTLTGGTGADEFRFTSRIEGTDTIRDFAADDRISILSFGFGGGLVAGGAVTLVANGNPVVPAGSTGGVFLYDKDTGALSFDVDGAGAEAAIQIAVLRNGGSAADLAATQFLVL